MLFKRFFWKIEKVLVASKISFGEKNYNYFSGYLYNDHKFKPLHMIFLKQGLM